MINKYSLLVVRQRRGLHVLRNEEQAEERAVATYPLQCAVYDASRAPFVGLDTRIHTDRLAPGQNPHGADRYQCCSHWQLHLRPFDCLIGFDTLNEILNMNKVEFIRIIVCYLRAE